MVGLFHEHNGPKASPRRDYRNAINNESVLDCNKASAEKAFRNEKMEFVWNSTIEEVLGEDNVKGVIIKNLKTGGSNELACQGVFFFVGMVPSTYFLKDCGISMDGRGYIHTNEMMETNLEGVYAIGDNRLKYLRQVVSAAADGATAAVAAERYIEELKVFDTNIILSDKNVLLLFFNASDNESLEFSTLLDEANQEIAERYKIVKVDVATKKNLALKYGIEKVPAVVVLDKGEEVKRLNCALNKNNIKFQL